MIKRGIQSKVLFSGQRRRYGDSYLEVEVFAPGLSRAEAVDHVFTEYNHSHRLPPFTEWQQKQKTEGAGYYFSGYYTAYEDKNIKGSWFVQITRPYCD